MSILNDKQILELCRTGIHAGLIDSYSEKQVREIDGKKIISYGLSSFGYDARVADEFMEFVTLCDAMDMANFRKTGTAGTVVDPKRMNTDLAQHISERDIDGSYIIPPHSFTLCRTVEYFRIPDDVMVICLGKSTYARCGLIVNVTPLEPGWCGHVTLELSNTTPLPIKVYPGEGICQFVFFRGERPKTTYADRAGKYQGQRNITPARL